MLVEQGAKPEEIVKIINTSSKNEIINNFSDDSDEEIDNKEDNLIKKIKIQIQNHSNNNIIKSENSDTESDDDMKIISDEIEKENFTGRNSVFDLEKLKKFIEKNNTNLKPTKNEINYNLNNVKKETLSPTKLKMHHTSTSTSTSNNINSSGTKDFLNKKRTNDKNELNMSDNN